MIQKKLDNKGRMPSSVNKTTGEPIEHMVRRIRKGTETIDTPIPIFDKDAIDDYHEITPWANVRTDKWEERILNKEKATIERNERIAREKEEQEEYKKYKEKLREEQNKTTETEVSTTE